MVDALDDGFAAGNQACNHEAGGGAQVGGHHGGAGEFFHAVDKGGVAFGGDVRAHAVEFGHVHEAVFKNGFHHFARTFGHGVHCHKLRLHVGGKTGVHDGADVHGFGALLHIDGNPVVARFDNRACFNQLVEYGFHRFGCGVTQHDFTARHRYGTEESTGFDAVGHNAVFAAV